MTDKIPLLVNPISYKEILEESNKKEDVTQTIKLFPLVINTIIGTGIFGLPFAYNEAGIYASIATLLIVCVINMMTSTYVLETIARIPVLLKSIRGWFVPISESPFFYDNNEYNNEYINDYHSINGNTQLNKQQTVVEMKPQTLLINDVYGYIEMGSILGKNILKWITTLCLTLNCYVALWAYVATVLNTLTTVVWMIIGDPDKCNEPNHFQEPWDCNITYYVSLIVYGLIVIPICFMDLNQQTIIQTVLTIIRFTAFFLMIITCIIQLSIDGPMSSERSVFGFYPSGFGTMFTHTIFAFILQPTIPNLVEATKGSRKYVNYALSAGIIVSACFYAFIGIVCASTFNSQVQTPVTLNWANYTGRNGGWGEGTETWWAYIIKYFILIVPVFNLTSTIPLVSHTISMNLQSLFPEEYQESYPKKAKYLSRALAIFPPFLLTCFIDSLEIIFDFAGLISFFLVFTFPCVFVFISMFKLNGFRWFNVDPKTSYTHKYISSPITVILVFTITFVAFIAAVVFLIEDTILSNAHNDDSLTG